MRTVLTVLMGLISAGAACAQQTLPAVSELSEPAVAAPSTNRLDQLDVSAEMQSERVTRLMEAAALYAEEGEFEAAERAYLKAREEEPENLNIQFRLSTLYIQMQRYPEAISLLKKLVEKAPDNPIVHNNLAWVYSSGTSVRDREKALYHAREAILSAPMSPSMWNTLAEAYYISGQYEKALRSSEHAIDLLVSAQGDEATLQSFVEQYEKIKRAQEALKIFEGGGD